MTPAPSGHAANVLGALMLATSDRMVESVEAELGLSETAAAALSALDSSSTVRRWTSWPRWSV